MSIMTIVIYIGYSNAYRTNIEFTTVNILGLPIYELTKTGSNYAGDTIGPNMGFFCGICMLISLLVKALISKSKKK